MRATWKAAVLLIVASPLVAQRKPATVRAFDGYVAAAEARIRTEESSRTSFLRTSPADARLRRGDLIVDKVGQTPLEIDGGMIHDWVGNAFLPGATVGQVLALVQDYDHTAEHYQPEVQASRLVARDGDDFHIFMRLRKHKVANVLLDTEYDVHYGHLAPQYWYSESRSTRIAEADGGDHGFLWRLNTYWRFVQVDDGVMVQCEAISLTRDIPTGLGWMIGPFVTKIPRESLEFTMSKTRAAVLENHSANSTARSRP